MSASYYNPDGSSKNSPGAHFSGATGERVKAPSGLTSDQQYFKGLANDLKNVPDSKKRVIDTNLLDINKGGKRRTTRRNKRKSRGRKSRGRKSRRR